MVRIVVFVNEFGSVEHDGGWALGISRSLAERGTYTSLSSTVVDPNQKTGFNYDDLFTVQDEKGREYFFVAHTTGPGVVLPNAVIFKLFGVSFWSSRAGPLIFFLLFLILTTGMLYYIQGLVSVVIFHLYLYFFPQLYIFLGYEANGEVSSMVYLLISFVLFIKATEVKHRVRLWFFLCGLFVGITLNTRLPTLIAFGGLAIVWFILYRQKKTGFKEAFMIIAGLLLVAALWQLYIFITLMQVSDFPTYLNHVWGRLDFFLRSLKGITPIAEGMELFLLKAIILSEISRSHLLVSLLLVLVTGMGGIWLIRELWTDQPRRNMTILLWVAWLIYTIWFLNGPKNAWTRYYWYGLIWMTMLMGLLFGMLVRRMSAKPGTVNIAGTFLLGLLFLFSFSSQPQALHVFITPELIEVWHQRQLTTRDTYLPWIIIPRAEQAQVVEFIRNLPKDANIYYPEGHKTAEISFLTNRIFYTIPRRKFMGPHPDDVAIMGPALISPWKKERQQRLDILETIQRECPMIVLETPNYIICNIGTVE
ncbi:MAG: hypothetical protein JXM69_05845 [Anaerolineae bacterium]|nr:hypothetical protein [Anaerolineae bacterium]